ncbi:methyltransferase family protein [Georgenia soli]|uniref:Methyltransferase family protein n=1 Tax=Georgenia soli TaxID=638953 RepID=A0A2A9ERE5_9MICO|nr:methyltransferase domain-containing protein [Georgenia soli]PFG41101.1 methyltransferase family protein [Georgenia soli]
MDDGTRWDERYRDAPDPVPRPPDGLTGLVHLLPEEGRALDVACGLGAVTLWAAGRGLAVDALDVSAVAIRRLTARADALGLTGVHGRVADLAAGLPEHLSGPYDLVVCQRFRDPALHRSLPGLLAPDGVLVLTVLSDVGATAPSRFAAEAGELSRLARASGCEVLRDVERHGEATVVLRRPGPRSGSACGAVREDGRDGRKPAREGP